MNQDTEILMFGVVDRVEQAIRDRDCPAVVAVQGDRVLVLSDYDYLRDRDTAVAFEERAAAEAREIHAVRFVLAVPQVWLSTEGDLQARAVSNLPLREGEREVIAWMSYDTGAGIDYGHTPYVRRPNGTPVFDDPEIFTAPVRPYEVYPGRHLLRTLLDGEDGPPGDA